MRLRPRHRIRLALVVIVCLLFQQVAWAAYACPMQHMPPQMAVMAERCAEMGMPQAQDNPALCAKHCAPELSTAADHVKLSVPALMLPPLGFAPPLVPSVTQVAVQTEIPIERSDPPSRLRYCSLLI